MDWHGHQAIRFRADTLGLELAWLKGSVITYGSMLMVVLAVVIWYVLNRTAFGRHVYATGDDPTRRGWPASTPTAR